MSKILWLGHAPNIPQIDQLSYNEGTVLTEGADVTFTCNGKSIVVESPSVIEDESPSVTSDTGGLLSMLQACEAAINGSAISEFGEVTAEVITYDETIDNNYHVLKITGPDGIPFTIEVTAGGPQVDIDVNREGTPGVDECQSIAFISTLTSGKWSIIWDLVGAGTSTGSGTTQFSYQSDLIDFDGSAENVQEALINGIEVFEDGDVEVTGVGSETSPFIICLRGDTWGKRNVATLQVDTGTLTTKAGEAFTITEETKGGEGTFTYVYAMPIPVWNHSLDRTEIRLEEGEWIPVNHSGGTFQESLDNHPLIGSDNWELIAEDDVSDDYLGGEAISYEQEYYHPASKSIVYFRLIGEAAGIPYQIRMYSQINLYASAIICNPNGGEVYNLGDPGEGAWTLTYNGNTSSSIVDQPSRIELSSATITEIFDYQDAVFLIDRDYQWYYEDQYTGSYFYPRLLVIRDPQNTNVSDITATNRTSFEKIQDGGDSITTNEIVSIWTTATSGFFSITYTDGSVELVTSLIPVGSPAEDVQNALENILGSGQITVSGNGTETNPYVLIFRDSLSGTNIEDLSISGVAFNVEVVEEGSPPLGSIWHVHVPSEATSGTIALSFLGRTTSYFAYDGNATVVLNALEAMEPGNFADVFSVSGSGTLADPWIIEAIGTAYLGVHYILEAENDQLVGPNNSLTYETIQEATGKWHIDNNANWKNIETGETNLLPTNGDEIFVQIGGEQNSIRYGDLSSVLLKSYNQSQLFSGHLGLREINPNGYVEYRPTEIILNFGSYGQSFDNPNIIIGTESGQGSGLMRINTTTSEVHMRIEQTGGPIEQGRPSFVWRGILAGTGTVEDYLNTLQFLNGSGGSAVFAGKIAELQKVTTRGGVFRFGENTKIANGGLDLVNTEIQGRLKVGSDMVDVIFGG